MNFSAQANNFFPDDLRAAYEATGTWPADAVKVTEEEYATYGQGNPPAGYRRGADANGHPTWVEIPPEPAADRRARQLTAIDTAAGAARMRYVSAGQLIEEEYRQALTAVQQWRADGSPATAVPPEVQSGADYSGITHEEAAVEIEQTAASWEGVLSQIRDLRLSGKASVKKALDAEIETTAQGYIDKLKAMTPVSG